MLYPCRECGNDVSEGARRCPYCGAKRPMIRTALRPKGVHKPAGKPSLDTSTKAIGGAVVVAIFAMYMFGRASDTSIANSAIRAQAEPTLTEAPALYDEVERYVIEPCLRAFLAMDPIYLQASNKPERERSFRYDPRIRSLIDDTVVRSVAIVKDVAVLEDRQALYKGMLATCSAGAS